MSYKLYNVKKNYFYEQIKAFYTNSMFDMI